MDTLILNGSDLSLETLYQVVFERRKVEIAPEALERAEKARQVLFDAALSLAQLFQPHSA